MCSIDRNATETTTGSRDYMTNFTQASPSSMITLQMRNQRKMEYACPSPQELACARPPSSPTYLSCSHVSVPRPPQYVTRQTHAVQRIHAKSNGDEVGR